MYSNQTTFLRKSTSATRMLKSGPVDQIMFFVRRFMVNVDWVYDLLSVIDKLIDERDEFTRFERLIIADYLQFSLVEQGGRTVLRDRFGTVLEIADLLHLREQILTQCDRHALYLLNNPKHHTMPKAFKQVLSKIGYQHLSEEEHAILREAYIREKNGSLYTLNGRLLELPDFAKRLLWKLIG